MVELKTKRLFAHSVPDQPIEKWHLLGEHLRAVAQRASDFAANFSSADWGWNAGLLHDLGKATNAFQRYILKSNGLDDSDYDKDGSESNHASAGAALAADELKAPGKIISYLIAGHHSGLPDWYTEKTGNAALPIRLIEGRKNLNFIKDYANELLADVKAVDRPGFVKPNLIHFWMRMLFSCLVDADFLDTEKFIDSNKSETRCQFAPLEALAKVFFQTMERKEQCAGQTPVNKIRSEIRQACERASEGSTGLFLLTVPTGGGKTLSAMGFAFRHALKHGKKRIIYVIPYTSIIEQTAKVLSDFFGSKNVVEHHSNLSPESETQQTRMAAENWDAPIIVTTNVQFFESCYAAKSSRCRKLHNIVNSIVILDEAQLLPPELLGPCVDIINELTRNYDVTLLLSTATQPALPNLDAVTEIIPPEMNLYEKMKRTEIHFPDNLNQKIAWCDLAEKLKGHTQVLCIVGSRRDCYDLYRLMPESTIHLSALMCGAHRSKIISEIKKRLTSGESCRVISTQLIEAGVDVDFPVVYRALAGLDSIAQAAGRCNREGKLERLGQVHVFVPPKQPPRGILLKGESKTRELCQLSDFDPQSPWAFNKYFKLFYESLNDMGSRFSDLLSKDVNPDLNIQFRTAASEFKLIDDQAQSPIFVRYHGSKEWLDQLRIIGPKRQNMRALQRYTVNLSKWVFEKAKGDGLLEEVYKDFWCWAPPYDEKIGVDIFGAGWRTDDLII